MDPRGHGAGTQPGGPTELTDSHGRGSGLAATLRDYGRFALIAVDGGQLNGRALVPPGWFNEAGTAHRIGGKAVDYGYMWWIPTQSTPMHVGAFEAAGISVNTCI